MIARRGVMRLLAGAPFVSKLAGEQAALVLSQGVQYNPPSSGGGLLSGGEPVSQSADEVMPPDAKRAILKAALNVKDVRDRYDSILYERYRHIERLDWDLAANKSYSLSAKIAYQRQRMVAREREEDIAMTPWQRGNQFITNLLQGRLR